MPPSVAMFPVRILLLINLSDGRHRAVLCLGPSHAKWQPHEKGTQRIHAQARTGFFSVASRAEAC